MNGHDVISLGFSEGPLIGLALFTAQKAVDGGYREKDVKLTLSALKENRTGSPTR